MTEAALWSWLRPYLPQGEYTRIETGETGPGTPDVFYQLNKRASGWLELKDAKHPSAQIPFKDHRDGIRLSQEAWIPRNLEAGARIWLVLGIGRRVLWLDGGFVRMINGASRDALLSWSALNLSRDSVDKIQLKIIKNLLRISP